ncbi:helix-turn-helix domain-containing protein [Acidiphilium sp. PM]|uniref:helix-turn-helix domain-containing protein n=1 Tax=Acidiphilium sp. PM TaxID=1043206 RepID=UPI001300EC20|nr:helix-turn-helix domain-containing protein [Acidiphilium sp. PM]
MSAALDDFELEPLLTKADVARLLKVTPRTINNMIVRGIAGRPPLKPVMTGSILRFDPAHVRAWLAASPDPTETKEPVKQRGRPKKYRPGKAA